MTEPTENPRITGFGQVTRLKPEDVDVAVEAIRVDGMQIVQRQVGKLLKRSRGMVAQRVRHLERLAYENHWGGNAAAIKRQHRSHEAYMLLLGFHLGFQQAAKHG